MQEKVKDLIMIGAGPSALTAAVYTAREGIETTLYEKASVGGLVATIDKIDNYPGFPDGIEGFTLAEQLGKQAKNFGAQIEYGDVTAIRDDGAIKVLTIDGEEIKAKAVLIASGSSYRKLNVVGEKEYYGRGVHYCATCDGAFYRGKKLVVVGGGNSAIQEGIFLARFADHIDILSIGEITATEILQRNLKALVDAGKINVHLNTIIKEIVGENGKVTAVEAAQKDKSITFETDGVFVFIGLAPNTEFLAGSDIKLDKSGFIITDEKLQTNITGVFASGDVRSGSIMQVAVAVGEGATAAIGIREYLNHGKMTI